MTNPTSNERGRPISNEQRRRVFIDHLQAAISSLDMRNAYRGPMAPDRAILTTLVEYLSGDSSAPETSAPLTHSTEPSAYLKLWDQNGPRVRVDLTPINEPWLECLKPIVTPLYARLPGPAQETTVLPTSHRPTCEGGTGGPCTQPDCEKCWDDEGRAVNGKGDVQEDE